MSSDSAQGTWDSYFSEIRSRRIGEAEVACSWLRQADADGAPVVILEFGHFAPEESSIRSLAEQLGENYTVTLRHDEPTDCWHASGTTRPDACELDEESLRGWVEFMFDVARSYSCVFSTFRLEDPQSGRSWSNEDVEVEGA